MFKDKRFLSWRRKSIDQKRKNMRKKSIELKKQNFLLKMQKKRAFQKFKCLIFKCKKKSKQTKYSTKYKLKSHEKFIQENNFSNYQNKKISKSIKKEKYKNTNRHKDNLFYIIDARFEKRGLDMPYSVERWIIED